MNSKKYYQDRFHPQRALSRANIMLYHAIITLTGVKSIFEFGCGIGRHLERLNRLGYDCSGMDINPEAVEEARNRELKVLIGDETRLHKIRRHDLVFTNSVLCHIKDVNLAMKELKRIAFNYIINVECIDRNEKHWYIHEYEGKELFKIKSDIGATYKAFLIEL